VDSVREWVVERNQGVDSLGWEDKFEDKRLLEIHLREIVVTVFAYLLFF